MSISILVPARFSSGLWGLRPPGASRCCARASLRTPSRPHPRLIGSDECLYSEMAWPIAFVTGTINVTDGVGAEREVATQRAAVKRWGREVIMEGPAHAVTVGCAGGRSSSCVELHTWRSAQ